MRSRFAGKAFLSIAGIKQGHEWLAADGVNDPRKDSSAAVTPKRIALEPAGVDVGKRGFEKSCTFPAIGAFNRSVCLRSAATFHARPRNRRRKEHTYNLKFLTDTHVGRLTSNGHVVKGKSTALAETYQLLLLSPDFSILRKMQRLIGNSGEQ